MEDMNVVLEGRVLPGIDPAVARARLAKLLQRDEAFVAKLLIGRQITIKSGVDHRRGEQYINALRDAGVSARLEPSVLALDEDVWTRTDQEDHAAPSAVAQVGSPTAQMPRPQGLAALRETKAWRIASTVVGIAVLAGAVLRFASGHFPAKPDAAAVANPAPSAHANKQDTRQAGKPQVSERRPTSVPEEPPKTRSSTATNPIASDLAELFKRFMLPSE